MNLKSLYLRKKFWINDFLHGSQIGIPYREIKYISEHTEEECRTIREEKLKTLLHYARTNSPFYKKYTSDKLSDFPIMNKLSLIENYDAIKVKEDKIPGQNGKVFIQKTSGSTGTPFAIPQDTQKRLRRIAELKYFGKIVGFNTHEVLVQLRAWNKWQSKTIKQIKTENIFPFDISDMGGGKLKILVNLIKEQKAVCLRGYASSFDLLAKYVKEHPTDFPHLKIVIAGSEALHEDTRENVKKYLGCEIISQYANEECGILAQERIPTKATDNVMYLNHSGYFFEVLKFDSDEPVGYGELGRIVITDLHNHAFPIIRYDNGDAGILLPPNEFSNGYPVLGKLYGRRFDVCYTTEGDPFSPMMVGRTLKHFEDIAQWQFIQKGEKEYVLKVVLKENVNKNNNIYKYLKPAIEELQTLLGENATISIEEADEIPVLASGKRKPVVNEWKK